MPHLLPFIETAGYLGMFLVIFAETGLLFGFFLPGDTLLFSVGVLAYQGYFHFPAVITVLSLAGILGGFLGYWIGKTIGPKIFSRKDSPFFKKANAVRAEKFFEKYGSVTVFVSRYVPVVRTFSSTVAGIAGMDFKKFLIYNIAGAIAWASSITLLGYYLGQKIPNIDSYLLPVVAIVCGVSFLPVLFEVFKRKYKTDSKV